MALPLSELLPALHGLSRGDKLRAMKFLVQELERDEDLALQPGAQYEVWSPYDSSAAAEKLLAMLTANERGGVHDS